MNENEIETYLPLIGAEAVKRVKARLDNYYDAAASRGLPLIEDETFRAELVKVFYFSEFVAASASVYPELVHDLYRSGELEKAYEPGVFFSKVGQAVSDGMGENETKQALLKIRLYEMIRIAWRDLTQKAFLDETLNDLSCFADACIDTVLDFFYAKLCRSHGTPSDEKGNRQKLVVIGMGKLGARELNFSSDIDLIFVYGKDGTTDGDRPLENEKFFTKLARMFLKFFDSGNQGSNFFRVDTRLRPFGGTGPLVMNRSGFEHYYQSQGREWERYALIKARPVAGDKELGERILENLEAFVYRRYFDYGTFESFRDMKKRISMQTRNENLKRNVKLGPGGIREVEFFGQIFQMIRGGIEPQLKERRILRVLKTLEDLSCIDHETLQCLSEAYTFLRRVENRLQEYDDLQTHDLPVDAEGGLRLALSAGFDSHEAFMGVLETHMNNVHSHFNELLGTEEDENGDENTECFRRIWENLNDPQAAERVENISCFQDFDQVYKPLKALKEHSGTKQLTAAGQKRLSRLVPLIVQKAGESPEPGRVLGRLVDLVTTIQRRSCYISLLLENKGALDTLASLARKSPWIISFLSKHPALLDELLDPGTLFHPPEKKDLEEDLEKRMAIIPEDDHEMQLETLCVFKQTQTLKVAAADVSGGYPLMKVSDRLTYIAETVLDKVLDLSWHIVMKKYGLPPDMISHGLDTCGFAIIAYGKVGGYEMGYSSDIDLIFIHSGSQGQATVGEKPIEVSVFYSNLGQRIVNVLTMHTPAGKLYGADMRLRPRGQAGTIVSHVDALKGYLEDEAWTWEMQALIRARPVSGDTGLQKEFNRIRTGIIRKERDPDELAKNVREMRERMRKEHLKVKKGFFDIKQGRGGIVDIEFIVQYLVLKESHSHPGLVLWTDNVRLLETLESEQIISKTECARLKEAYLAMRKAIHRLNLQEKEHEVPDTHFSEMKKNVVSIYENRLYK
ncbi:MAG: bifunctional [glutamate--ammonia ligase]-adenylyl-L-tyrosine phosphorylase/[glutamate--ammonia-ligase] adenylyltransferase [Thermodesulfobacteriota bacterium]